MTHATIDKKTMSKRRWMRMWGGWALGIGAAVLFLNMAVVLLSPDSHGVLGNWLFAIGWALLIMGIGWVVGSVWASDEPMSQANLRYIRQAMPGMGAYALAILVLSTAKHADISPWLKGVAALLPVLPMIWVVFSMWRLLRDSDELERRIGMESIYVTCGVVGLVTFAAGMLQIMDLLELQDALFYVLPLMFCVYGVTQWFVRRKYGLSGAC